MLADATGDAERAPSGRVSRNRDTGCFKRDQRGFYYTLRYTIKVSITTLQNCHRNCNLNRNLNSSS